MDEQLTEIFNKNKKSVDFGTGPNASMLNYTTKKEVYNRPRPLSKPPTKQVIQNIR